MQPDYTVTELSVKIKQALEGLYSRVTVVGEISGMKVAQSGHAYFSLKDEHNTIACTCWKAAFDKVEFKVSDGMSVSVSARITTYGAQSRYQLNVLEVRALGAGSFMQAFLKLKAKLELEGLFDVLHKKPLPSWPNSIGIITSMQGAVLWDMLHRIRDRFPTHVAICPVAVQGSTCLAEVIKAIEQFNSSSFKEKFHAQVIVIARGGGSIEDLWGFNDEALVRAIFASDIPVVSAIGHETDFTLADFVADLRAPTPTAAAEMITPVWSELKAKLDFYSIKLSNVLSRYFASKALLIKSSFSSALALLRYKEQQFDDVSERFSCCNLNKYQERLSRARLSHKSLIRIIVDKAAELNNSRTLLKITAENYFYRLSQVVEVAGLKLEKVDFKGTLKRGFVLVRRGGSLVRLLSDTKEGEILTLEFLDGRRDVQVLGKLSCKGS